MTTQNKTDGKTSTKPKHKRISITIYPDSKLYQKIKKESVKQKRNMNNLILIILENKLNKDMDMVYQQKALKRIVRDRLGDMQDEL